MKTLIVGMGEVGRALHKVLSPVYEVHTKDIEEKPVVPGIEIMHVCIRHGEDFVSTVGGYLGTYQPRLVNICTTVPPGTTERFGSRAVHSTTRGLHPNLTKGLTTIPKHVGGPEAEEVAKYFERAGIPYVTHKRAITTELAHLLSNINYGINLMFADEMARICRHYGVDYYEAVMRYNQTGNEGFSALDMDSKCRMILTPPGGYIGGHCVVQAAEMLIRAMKNKALPNAPLTDMLSVFNGAAAQNENHPLRKEGSERTIFQHTGNGHSGAEAGPQDMCEGTKR